MPPSRGSIPPPAAAGPSRLPYQSPKGPSWNITVDEEGHLESDTLNIASQHKPNTPRGRSVSFQPPDLNLTPRQSRNKRKTSGGSHYSIRLTPPIQTPSSRSKSKGKAVIRKSLTGENALGMNINDRAEVLADVAGDCLVTLVRAALRDSSGSGNRRRSSINDEVKKAWEGLYGIRQSYLFPPWSPPFPSFIDILRSLHSQIRATLNAQALSCAIDLSNLATFIWTISRPDEACLSFPSLDVDGEDGTAPRRSTRNKEKDQENLELVKRVKLRNMLLLIAWKKFWLIVVPEERRTSEIALRLWLDFATQIALLYQRPSVEGVDLSHSSLPRSSDSLLAELFSPSAVGRFGQWSISEDFDSQEYSEEKADVEERWRDLAQRRTEELANTSHADLRRRYPYSEFRTEMIAYVQHEILASPINTLLTPGRRELLAGHDDDLQRFRLEYQTDDSLESEGDETEIADWHHDSDIDEEDSDGDNGVVMSEGTPIDMDILEMAAAQLEAEANAQHDEEEETHEIQAKGSQENNAEDMAEVDIQIPVLEETNSFQPTSAQQSTSHEDSDEEGDEGDWAVKDAPTSSAMTNGAPNIFRGNKQGRPTFDWTKRQDDAVQVEWESQSNDGPTPSSPVNRRQAVENDADNTENEDAQIPQSSPSPSPPADPAFGLISPSVAARLIELNGTASPPPLRAQRLSFATSRQSRGASNQAIDQPVCLTSPLFVEEEEEEAEMVEGVQDPSNDEEDHDDLIPTESQFGAMGLSFGGPAMRRNETSVGDEDDEFAELLPSESQFAVGRSTSVNGNTLLHTEIDNNVNVDSHHQDMDLGEEDNSLVPPTSQGQYISSRPRKSQEAHSFVPPDPEEDLEDRQLLFQPSSPSISVSREASVKIEPVPHIEPQHMLDLHGFVNRLHPTTYRRQRGSSAPYIREEDDPFLHEDDGSPLEPDELCLLPVDLTDENSSKKSKLFGKIADSSSKYCRLSGRRKWTLEEELLLYRTVQKVPLQEEYPLRIVWNLYGEFGRFGKQLKWYSTQHMKDKLRTTVKRRQNEGRLVEGRVRAWAARGTREREEWEDEWEEYKRLEEEEEDDDEAGEEDIEADGDNEHGDRVDDVEHEEDEGEGDDVSTDDDRGNHRSRSVDGRSPRDAPRYVEIGTDDDDFPEAIELPVNAQPNGSPSIHGDDEIPQPRPFPSNENLNGDQPIIGEDDGDFPEPESLDINAVPNQQDRPNAQDEVVDDDDFPSAESIDLIPPQENAPIREEEDFPAPPELPSTSTSAQTQTLAQVSDPAIPASQSQTDRYPSRVRKRLSYVPDDLNAEDEDEDSESSDNEGRGTGRKRTKRQPLTPIIEIPISTHAHDRSPVPLTKRRSKEITLSRPARPVRTYGGNRAARKVSSNFVDVGNVSEEEEENHTETSARKTQRARKTTSSTSARTSQRARKTTSGNSSLRLAQTARKSTSNNNSRSGPAREQEQEMNDGGGGGGGNSDDGEGDGDFPEPEEDTQVIPSEPIGTSLNMRSEAEEERQKRIQDVVMGKRKHVLV
ncbi:hypothetical protein I302_102216 [Kwoniella bestiolae CBS 10118]|uniref:Uncharacterized protein n=1 Tax=Kwoniella bestiolae CBS 10118 TaxID=1296100 RepID=A0A1B9GEK8_9TREE|nr:hypothetical protein I302_00906 [Kwoniella bestiolae CBS 10118]OCF29401.1 hypothetical protein I302_00906 [Kwoniella bestiolae CBS 10118]